MIISSIHNYLPILVLIVVFLLISFRRFGNFKFEIWQVMTGGAIIVLLFANITPINAFHAINFEVILFLFSMFVIGHSLEKSGYLSHISYKILKKTKTANQLLFSLIFLFGFGSAILMNDTLAIIGVPVILLLSKKHDISIKPFILALCFSVTIGSVFSPIGNPQNLLIAINSGIKNPFLIFFEYLLIPSIINLVLLYFLIKLFYKDSFKKNDLTHSQEPIHNKNLAKLSKLSLIILIILIITKILFVLLNIDFELKLDYIAFASALPILLLSNKRIEIIKEIDWHTIIFFISMFILMQAVWDTGFFQNIFNSIPYNLNSIISITIISLVLSQFISNVPLVALYLPLMITAGAGNIEFMALAFASTIAGNIFILGAASNVIVIQNVEKRKSESISFYEFTRIGIPLTIINIAIYLFYFKIFF